jgi:hypothetical protein
MTHIHVAFLLVFAASTAYSADDHYVCTIKVEHDLQDDGTVRTGRMSNIVVGQRFVVDRLTGIVRGNLVSTEGADKIVVVDKGSKANSFKSYWTHPRLASAPVAYLEIR